MTLEIVPAVEIQIAQQAATMTDAFTGYLAGDIRLNAGRYAAMLARDGIDLNLSRFALRDGEPIALGLVARRGWSSRLAAMGVVRNAQEGGIGRILLDDLVVQARERGDRVYWLECFEQNTRGIRLYSRMGFETVQRLYGYQRDALGEDVTPEDVVFEYVDPSLVGEMVAKHGAADLPWQISAATVINFGPPFSGVHLDSAYALISPTTNWAVMLLVLVVPEALRGQGRARQLVEALIAHYPDKAWRVPQLCPETFVGFYEKLGFKRQELNQVQMRLDLTANTGDVS